MKTTDIVSLLRSFLTENSGVTAIEYALIAALIFVVIVTTVVLVGANLNTLYEEIAIKLAAAIA